MLSESNTVSVYLKILWADFHWQYLFCFFYNLKSTFFRPWNCSLCRYSLNCSLGSYRNHSPKTLVTESGNPFEKRALITFYVKSLGENFGTSFFLSLLWRLVLRWQLGMRTREVELTLLTCWLKGENDFR